MCIKTVLFVNKYLYRLINDLFLPVFNVDKFEQLSMSEVKVEKQSAEVQQSSSAAQSGDQTTSLRAEIQQLQAKCGKLTAQLCAKDLTVSKTSTQPHVVYQFSDLKSSWCIAISLLY